MDEWGLGQVELVGLRRGACYGPCPVYEVTLGSNGNAEWNGEAFVEREGRWLATFDGAVFSDLAAMVVAVGFFDWDAEYSPEMMITDLPTYELFASREQRTKTVQQYGTEEPSGFGDLADAIDAVVAKLEWRPTRARPVRSSDG